MRVKLTVNFRMPNMNVYVDKGTIMEVIDVRGQYYICKYKEYQIMILKGNVEVIEK